jgi:hypothetical protein
VGSRAISDRRRYVVHGLGVEIDLDWAALAESADRLLRHFATDYFPPGFNAVFGQIRPYEQSEVLRSLSPTASRLDSASGLLEIYHENERFWLVDERWGLTEINLLKGQWRSWVLPHASMDPVQCVEHAILWPMAQVLRPKGLHLLPAVSIARSGWAALILTPFNIEPELRALIDAGFQVIGQRWTAMREEEGRISLLHLPGLVQPMTSPRLKHRHGAGEIGQWVDLVEEHPDSFRHHAFCDAVLLVEAGRRSESRLVPLSEPRARLCLRRDWPIAELHPSRKPGMLPAHLARQCRCAQMQLSREPGEIVSLIEEFRLLRPTVSVNPRLNTIFSAASAPRELNAL